MRLVQTCKMPDLMRRALSLLAAGTLMVGCPGSLVDPERFTNDGGGGPCDVEANIFIPSCGGSGCHQAPGPQLNLDLVTPGVAARIKGATSTCQAKPMTTLILEKVKPGSGCGSMMPPGASPGSGQIEGAALKCLEDYLANLADGGS